MNAPTAAVQTASTHFLAGMAPTDVFRRALEEDTDYRCRGVISFTGWSTLLLVERPSEPGVLRVAKGLFGYNSVLDAAPQDVRAGLYGYYWYRQLPAGAQSYATRKFLQEIKILERLQGTGACPELVRSDPDASIPYYIMEYLPKGSLRSWLATDGPEGPAGEVTFARTLLRALVTLQEHGVVHRDLNAENVLMSADGAVIADYGCALLEGEHESPSPKTALISWPPEYDAGYHQATIASDLYCFGMVMYELLTGTMPRYGAPSLTGRAGHDPRLSSLVEQCVSWRPEDRPSDARACLAALEATA